ncbi:acetyltransferase [Exiguobacterium sp. AM39-5BH]|uniref:acetyltransferase n=1 Tax=Exiguobacterium sp. AM39-5BH TaxID=2292355 RepID=UPI000FE221AF|nr:acetyltransferase [Exiguobacterium sp. AM39-5BH]RHB49589.1 transferase [Exiguobacterium sp. AM39-5BH]
MEWIVIFGAGGHAQVIIDIIELMGLYRIAGIYDDNPALIGKFVAGYPVLGFVHSNVVAKKGIIGIGDNMQRELLERNIRARMPDFVFINAIHPSAIISKNVTLGDGTAVMAGSVINPNAVIGPHSIINTMASVDHDCVLEPFASIAPGAHLGGNVHIGTRTFVGMSATIIHGLQIGHDTVIGAGATVVNNIPNHVVAYGSPAKPVRGRVMNERYL